MCQLGCPNPTGLLASPADEIPALREAVGSHLGAGFQLIPPGGGYRTADEGPRPRAHDKSSDCAEHADGAATLSGAFLLLDA